MSTPSSTGRGRPVNPTALAQRVSQQLRKHRRQSGAHPVLLIHAAPVWPYDPVLATHDGHQLRVVPCVSPLAVWEQLTGARDRPCVLLTELSSAELGIGILSRVLGRQVLTMEPWNLVAESFGTQQLDPRLKALDWAGQALIEATPADGWPRLPGTVLHRDIALRHLTAARFDPEQRWLTPDLDAPALLRWSSLPAAGQTVSRLAEVERTGLLAWLAAQFGPAVRVLEALIAVEHLNEALPLGLVCAALWASDDPDSLRAQGRVEQYLGRAQPDAVALRAFGELATWTTSQLLRAGRGTDPEPGPTAVPVASRQLSTQVLDRAEELLIMFGAGVAAERSEILRSGFEHRLGTVAATLRAALNQAAPESPELLAAGDAVESLAAHHLSLNYPHRVEPARMALRLVRWLGNPAQPPTGVADGINQQIAQWCWVDLALDHVWTGDDSHQRLASVYRSIHDRVRDRRRELDRHFADRLAYWSRHGGDPGDLLTVETVLERVIAPVVRKSRRGVLFIVLDGMSASVAADLAAELTGKDWVEYDPLAGTSTGTGTGARRRGAVAALPTVTSISRTALFTTRLAAGTQQDERARFESLPLWERRRARLFHKSTVQGEAGEVLRKELTDAISDPNTLVGVVINTVDDALDHGRESADAGWRLNDLGPLRALLAHARYQGRAVILTSDHGHVLERDGIARTAVTPGSARHRTDPAPAGDGEVELTGPRVGADGQRVVALWDPRLRYLPLRAGYHGGASLAEVTVPLLALLPLGAAAPEGWQPLGPQQPDWWSAPTLAAADPGAPARSAGAKIPTQQARRKNDKARSTAADADESALPLFDVPAETASAPGPALDPVGLARPALVRQVLDSEMYAAQHKLTPRPVNLEKIRLVLTALLEANGILPIAVLAGRIGEHPARATGFITTLQRILNVDNFPVLSIIDNGRAVRLDLPLLRQQFGLDRMQP